MPIEIHKTSLTETKERLNLTITKIRKAQSEAAVLASYINYRKKLIDYADRNNIRKYSEVNNDFGIKQEFFNIESL